MAIGTAFPDPPPRDFPAGPSGRPRFIRLDVAHIHLPRAVPHGLMGHAQQQAVEITVRAPPDDQAGPALRGDLLLDQFVGPVLVLPDDPLPKFLFILHADQRKSLGRRGRPGRASVPGVEDLLHVFRRIDAGPHLYQRPRDDPHHIVEEPAPADADRDHIPALSDIQAVDRADGFLLLSPPGAETAEIMLSDQIRGRLPHLFHVQREIAEIRVQPLRRQGDPAVQDPVHIRLRAVLFPRVPVRRDLLGTQRAYILRQPLVQRQADLIRRHAVLRIKHRDVLKCVYARVRPARADHRDLLAHQAGKGAVQHLLDRHRVLLILPAAVIRPVIRQDQSDTPQA